MNINLHAPPPPPSSAFKVEMESFTESETTIEVSPEPSVSLSGRNIKKCSPNHHLLSTFLPLIGINLCVIGIEISHHYHYIPLKEISYAILVPCLILLTIYQVMLKNIFKKS